MTTVVVEICEALQSRLRQGRYDALKNEVSEPWKELLQCHRKQHGTVGDDDEVCMLKGFGLDMFSQLFIVLSQLCSVQETLLLGTDLVQRYKHVTWSVVCIQFSTLKF